MIKPDWSVFAAKFSENPQANFEWLSYLLFCKEFNLPTGVFRYKNQAAIETEPIRSGTDIIGFQAKFWDSSPSDHKDEILDMLKKAKRHYPNITKIILFTNTEWGQNKGKKPKGRIEIEAEEKKISISIEWRCRSYFETEPVCTYEPIINHFFSYNKSIFDLLDSFRHHTENYFAQIQSSIVFKTKNIEIDKSETIKKLVIENNATIISGIGGVGKTAIIKKYYETMDKDISLFIFKATEFEVRSINDLFPDVGFLPFIDFYKNAQTKIIVIDSSEKLLELTDTEPFKEFLSELLKNKWRVVFTTRDNYLEDLNYQFFEIFNIVPRNIRIEQLSIAELEDIAKKEAFTLPDDEKILELIRIPFYFNEYLRFYDETKGLDYKSFKEKLWVKVIKKSKPEREQCFLQFAFEQANSGLFFIKQNYQNLMLENELVADGILGCETAGYYIAHDIYEEWALEKYIDSAFIQRDTNEGFFEKISESLPIRRSFRNWLSEKLFSLDKDAVNFIENLIQNNVISNFWKDEIFTAILLSKYSSTFFESFKSLLICNDCVLLKRTVFMLRISCKEVDYSLFNLLGIKKPDLMTLKYVRTAPKGFGWQSLIKFVYDNRQSIGFDKIDFFIPVIYEWNCKNAKGETTKYAALIALEYYNYSIDNDKYFIRSGMKEKIIKTILSGSHEIKKELETIFDSIFTNKWKHHNDPYYELSKAILVDSSSNFNAVPLVQLFPEYILKLFDLFLVYTPTEGPFSHYRSDIDREKYFNLESNHFDYYPVSSFQTPIYFLLKVAYKITVDFLLDFINRATEYYVHTDFDQSVKKVECNVHNHVVVQWLSHCLWNMYRGNGSPVSPRVLQSIHMALEKYLLEIGKNIDTNGLEQALFYLLEQSKSSSITAVVTSVVLAYPEKTFNVATVLFKTKEFIMQDTIRCVNENQIEMLYRIGYNGKHKIHIDERLKTVKEKHRNSSLEQQFLSYLLGKYDTDTDESINTRRVVLFEILDNYYKELETIPNETNNDKIWRISLARMDTRKMTTIPITTDKGQYLQLLPNLEPELAEYRKKEIEKSTKWGEYLSLDLWAKYAYDKDLKAEEYKQYNNNPKQVMRDLNKVIKNLKKCTPPPNFLAQLAAEEESYWLHYSSTPAYVCTVLMRDYSERLSQKEKIFCKDIILEFVSYPFGQYFYQAGDGVQQTISGLPYILHCFPELGEDIKILLLFLLFLDFEVGNIGQTGLFYEFSISAINSLQIIDPISTHSILLGYLKLKPKYDLFLKELLYKDHDKIRQNTSSKEIFEKIFNDNENIFKSIVDNTIILDDLDTEYNIQILLVAFRLLPRKIENTDDEKIINIVLSKFAGKLTSDDRQEETYEYKTKHSFLTVFSDFILNLQEKDLNRFCQPFIANISASEGYADFLKYLIYAEDKIHTYEKFWLIWNLFKDSVVKICNNKISIRNIDKIVQSYLFADIFWEENIKDWESIREREKVFFSDMVNKIGSIPSVLYSIAKLLNTVGSIFINEGIDWLDTILSPNDSAKLLNSDLNIMTVFYIENYIRRYIYLNNDKIRKTKIVKTKVVNILTFLIDSSSVVGYILRERIL
ncbi:AVAST type 4 anti-phage nuclease Avs4 [Treponema endosymbiont of Eucomonympha sp.]|uniref:AVAST type 4 anti-phage nuclease Avs4 n=1 Tax=Treponema endosymbiont of Eucomonympha sp. TaxID=1580831 RepID=UPI000750B8B1|nr:AVAST type 4 anti-phage nuclease Avs4 [Treponema endosymbiont of Eucomonympha sp.]